MSEGINSEYSVNEWLKDRTADFVVVGQGAGSKRARDGPPPQSHKAKKWYAVRVGRAPGIYADWQEASDQVRGVPRAEHKAFRTRRGFT